MTAIHSAAVADIVAVLDLLQRSGLPVAGLADHTDALVVARDGDRVVGSAAVELYGENGLLRSVAVDPASRGSGLGHRLTEAAIILARLRGVRDLFLLTTTAEDFFPRFGFVRVDREAVPRRVQHSVEFTSACPASAVVLRKHLDPR